MRELYKVDIGTLFNDPLPSSGLPYDLSAVTDLSVIEASELLTRVLKEYGEKMYFPQEKTETSVFNHTSARVLFSRYSNIKERQDAFTSILKSNFDKKTLNSSGHTGAITKDKHSPANAVTGRLTGESESNVSISNDTQTADGDKFSMFASWNGLKSPFLEFIEDFQSIVFPYDVALEILESGI